LVEIAPPEDLAPLHDAWRVLASVRLVFFVSVNAVERFFAARPASSPWPDGVDAAAPGPGTARALVASGVPGTAIVTPPEAAERFDSEALWTLLAPRAWQGARVLVVRGDGGRDWLGERLRDAGAEVAEVRAYRRVAPSFTGAARERLDAALADADTVWLFSSSEAIANLARAAASARWRDARAIATHPRIASRARSVGFGTVREASPTIDAVFACIQSIGP
jgi:uroporphyrinogen-III synthase